MKHGLRLRPWTPRRIAAAKRAVEREAQDVALFPELRRFATVADRQAQMDARSGELIARLRSSEAGQWRAVRRRVRWLTNEDVEGIAEHWNAGYLPEDPVYLLDLIRHYRNPMMT